MTVVAAAFAMVLAAMAGVTGIITLTLGFVGIRMLGQGAMSLYSTTAVSHWFERHRGRAVGYTAAGGQALMTVAPLSLAAVIAGIGWRQAWLVAAAVVGLVGLGIARLGLRDGPASVGQFVDGRPPTADDPAVPVWGATRAEAMHSLMFWAVTGSVVATGLIGTALAFHQVSVLGEQGLTPIEAAANFIPQTGRGPPRHARHRGAGRPRPATGGARGVHGQPGRGHPGFRSSPRRVREALRRAAIGCAGGSARALEAAALPRLFGTRHLGAIRGIVMAATVVGTAVAPVILSLGHDWSGSYLPALRVLLVLPIAVVVTGLLADTPDTPRHLRTAGEGADATSTSTSTSSGHR